MFEINNNNIMDISLFLNNIYLKINDFTIVVFTAANFNPVFLWRSTTLSFWRKKAHEDW